MQSGSNLAAIGGNAVVVNERCVGEAKEFGLREGQM